MASFIHEDFILNSKAAKVLYHDYAKDMPIYDYHCHLNPKEIAEDKAFTNISEIWLHGDHYKWRALRTLGIEEAYITGEADDKEKFKAWAKAVPYTIGNPLYHWTHLELKRYFDVDLLLNENTADEIWEHCNRLLQTKNFTVQSIIKKSNVKLIATTDDPIDDLAYHRAIQNEGSLETKVLPAFRPDKAVELTRPEFNSYLEKLAEASGQKVETYEDLLKAIENRANFFP